MAILFAFLVLFPVLVFAQEERCLELGTESTGICHCSEPLTDSVSTITTILSDPTSSPDAYECTNNALNPNPISGYGAADNPKGTNGRFIEGFSRGAPGVPNGSPGNLSYVSSSSVEKPLPGTPSTVLQVVHGAGGNLFGNNTEFTDSTWCSRLYAYYDDSEWPDFPNFNGNQDIKFPGRHIEPAAGDNPYMLCNWTNSGVGCTVPTQSISAFGYDPATMGGQGQWAGNSTPNQVLFNDAQKGWIRVERCYDHNSRGGGDADKLVRRMRVVRIDGSKSATMPANLSPNTSATARTGTDTQHNSFTTPDWINQPFPTGARSYYSHVMTALVKPADETFWIGKAYEIEGGGASPFHVAGALTVTPSSCEKGGGGCDDIDLASTASSTATGTIEWEKDCDLGSGFEAVTCSGGNDQLTCTAVDACDYDTETAQVYNPALRTRRDGGAWSTTDNSLTVTDAGPAGEVFALTFEDSSDFTSPLHCTDPTGCATGNPVGWSVSTTPPLLEGAQYATQSGGTGFLVYNDKFSDTELWWTMQARYDAISGDPGGTSPYITDDNFVHDCGVIGLEWVSPGVFRYVSCGVESGDITTADYDVTDASDGTWKMYQNVVTGVGAVWPPGAQFTASAPIVIQGATNANPMEGFRLFGCTSGNCSEQRFDDIRFYNVDPDNAPTPIPPSGANDIPCGTELFSEGFDSAITEGTRDWYDVGTGPVIDTTAGATACEGEACQVAGAGSWRCDFDDGENYCGDASFPGLRPGRHHFTATNSVYVSFYVKASSDWIGSGVGNNFHPHMVMLLTDQDDEFVGPFKTKLTTYFEFVNKHTQLSIQDTTNVDQTCILNNSGTPVGCTGGSIVAYPEATFGDGSNVFTEERSAASCNGHVGFYSEGSAVTLRDCFTDGVYNSYRTWRTSEESFADSGVRDKSLWSFIETYVELNSVVGGIGIPDGKIRIKQDGDILLSSNEILFRTGEHPTMLWDNMILTGFIGIGSPTIADGTQSLWIDELTVGTGNPDGACATPAAVRAPSLIGVTPGGNLQ